MYSYAYQLTSVNSNLCIMESIEKLVLSEVWTSSRCVFSLKKVTNTVAHQNADFAFQHNALKLAYHS